MPLIVYALRYRHLDECFHPWARSLASHNCLDLNNVPNNQPAGVRSFAGRHGLPSAVGSQSPLEHSALMAYTDDDKRSNCTYISIISSIIKVFHFWLLTLVVQSRYDKVTYSELKDRYLHNVVEVSPPFTQPAKDRLNDNINRLLDLYAKCVSRGDKTAARQQLRLHQRENIAWERDTVWRQMIGRQRRGEDSTQGVLGATLVQGPEPTVVDIPTPVGRFKITKRLIFKVAALAVFILLLNVQVVKGGEANRCFAILTFCTILWATEVKGFCCSSCFSFLLFKSNRLFRFS